ncbi:hypothetical protein Ga0609869_001806 [Rhodovulum iodosum]|uniref:Calcium-binding protein n=1 Tax=Rhodovulum iodosum TaxID=68291 RepID=A0ABV3XTQ5_9RHOB|nr:calcium-binding protein [Rhodovulum robiginosum]RSK39045.1 calcium-binding protein [Rhodovulum robiginosum]
MAEYIVDIATDTTDDTDEFLSLREAVAMAAATDEADTIVFADGLSTLRLDATIAFTDPALTIIGDQDGDGFADITISGPEDDSAIDGPSLFRFEAGAAVRIQEMRFRDVFIEQADGADGAPGDSILNSAGTDGQTPEYGAALLHVMSDATLTLLRSSFDRIGVKAGDGGDGGAGWDGTDGDSPAARTGDGDDGFDGGDGRQGGDGGNGAKGGTAAGVLLNEGTARLADIGFGSDLDGTAGRGGNSGPGGDGGDGGDGGKGGPGRLAFPAVRSGDGGDGGAGGTGGDSGDSGDGGDASARILNRGEIEVLSGLGIRVPDAVTGAARDGLLFAGGAGGDGGAAGEAGDRAFGQLVGGADGSPGSGASEGGIGIDGNVGVKSEIWLTDDGTDLTDGIPDGTRYYESLIYAYGANADAFEGETLEFSIIRTGETDINLEVEWTLEPAEDGIDADDVSGGLSGRVEFTAGGPDIRRVTIDVAEDELDESDEGFTFRLTDVSETSATDSTYGFGSQTVAGLVRDTTEPGGGGLTLTGTPDGDDLRGGAEGDTIRGLGGDDLLFGEGGADLIEGGDGRDTINGGDGDDTIEGGATSADRRDEIYGGDGNDTIDAGYGNDLVFGGGGDDTIAGGFGADDLRGQAGNDVITGSALSDLVFGGDGDDFVNGGFGYDRINGGAGADRFYHLGVPDHGSDWIQEYTSSEGDVLVFGGSASASDFQVNLVETEDAGTAGVEEAFVIYRPAGQILWALVDGGAQSSINIELGGEVFDLLA